MSPLDYLRAMTRRKKPAAGGIVGYGPDKPLVLPTGYIMPTSALSMPARTALPEGATIRLRGYTEMTAEERRQYLETVYELVGRPKPGPGPAKREQAAQAAQRTATVTAPKATSVQGCPCGVIYSRCYYPITHSPARPWTYSN